MGCAYCGRVIDTDGDWIEAVIKKLIGGTGFRRYSETMRTDNYHVKCWARREEQI